MDFCHGPQLWQVEHLEEILLVLLLFLEEVNYFFVF